VRDSPTGITVACGSMAPKSGIPCGSPEAPCARCCADTIAGSRQTNRMRGRRRRIESDTLAGWQKSLRSDARCCGGVTARHALSCGRSPDSRRRRGAVHSRPRAARDAQAGRGFALSRTQGSRPSLKSRACAGRRRLAALTVDPVAAFVRQSSDGHGCACCAM
jgi:hypothetical protein